MFLFVTRMKAEEYIRTFNEKIYLKKIKISIFFYKEGLEYGSQALTVLNCVAAVSRWNLLMIIFKYCSRSLSSLVRIALEN